MVLPFTILEISGLALVLWVMPVRSTRVEKVRIDDETVEIGRCLTDDERHSPAGALERCESHRRDYA